MRANLLYEFDGFRLDPQQRLLRTLAGDQTIELQPRVFDALLYFVQRPGDLLEKRELMQALWRNVVVEENSLNQVVSQLRKALGERPSEHRFIVTSPGRGYRFVAAVRVLRPEETDSGTAHPLSLAVLPFDQSLTDTGLVDIGGAIAADLRRLLSARSRLRVGALTADTARLAREGDLVRVGATLRVRRLVTGEVEGNTRELTVTARIVDATTGQTLWSRRLQGNLLSLAELQGDLARDLAQITDPEATRVPAPAAGASPESYLGYLRALAITQRLAPDTLAEAISELRRSIELSPQFPRARSLLAILYTTGVMFGFISSDALDLARNEVITALALDDQNGETYGAAAVIDCLGGNWCRAEERFRISRSLTADPMISGLACGCLTQSTGQLLRALQQAEYTLQAAPTHPMGLQLLATLNLALGLDAEAMRFVQLAVELGQSSRIAPLNDVIAQVAMRAGRMEEAVEHLRASLPARLQTPESDALLRQLHASMPAPTAASAAALSALTAALRPEELDPPMRKRLILWQVHIGSLDAAYELAFASLDHFGRDGTVGGAWGVLWLPEMQPFRDDERFQRFARRLRLFDYWTEYGPPDGYSLAGERLVSAT